MDYLVDWAQRHPDLLPSLAAWGREWSDDYPRFSEIMAECKELHASAALEATQKASHARLCDRVLAAIRTSANSFRKADKLTAPVLRSFADWWNKTHKERQLTNTTKKLLLPEVANILEIEVDED